jgi:hypothetical protein
VLPLLLLEDQNSSRLFMKAIRYILEDGPLWIALLFLITALTFCLYGWGILRPDPTIYWLFIIYGSITPQLACFFLPVSLCLLFIWVKLVKQEQKNSIYLVVASMMLLANFLACMAVPPMILGQVRHHGSSRLNGNVYYAGSSWKVGVGGTEKAYFWLFKCDSLGIFCEIVDEERRWQVPMQDFETIQVDLVVNFERQSVSMIVNYPLLN